jgi:hypothetical protein
LAEQRWKLKTEDPVQYVAAGLKAPSGCNNGRLDAVPRKMFRDCHADMAKINGGDCLTLDEAAI